MDAWQEFVGDAMPWADVRVALCYPLSAVLIGDDLFVLERAEKSPLRFRRGLVPQDSHLHPPHLVDVKPFVANRARFMRSIAAPRPCPPHVLPQAPGLRHDLAPRPERRRSDRHAVAQR